ncbi:MAG: hypothetical protein WDN47_01610 [Candidatus Doudnabacteria bacterium]
MDINSIFTTISEHPSGSSVVITAIVAWIIYRLGIWHTRSSVLNAIQAELDEGVQYWLSTNWPESRSQEIREDKELLRKIVFKIESLAIDNSIATAGSLFTNPELIKTLVSAKQALSNFNQGVALHHNFLSNAEVWDNIKPEIKKRAEDLLVVVHKLIGGEHDGQARTAYLSLRKELEKEKNSKVVPFIWLLTGLNFFRLKRFICRYFNI